MKWRRKYSRNPEIAFDKVAHYNALFCCMQASVLNPIAGEALQESRFSPMGGIYKQNKFSHKNDVGNLLGG